MEKMKRYRGESDAILIRSVNSAVETQRQGAAYEVSNDPKGFANCPGNVEMISARSNYYHLPNLLMDDRPKKKEKNAHYPPFSLVENT